MTNRTRIILKILPYLAGVIFAGMCVAALDVSSELSMMEDSGLYLYNDPVDIKVFWLESRACMMLPPDGYLTNCTYLVSISAILVLTVLLATVLATLMMFRRRERSSDASATRPQSLQ
jgi:hypothetical protein